MPTTYVLNEGHYTYTSSPYTYSNSQTNTSVNPVIRTESMTHAGEGSMSFYEIRTDNSTHSIHNNANNVFNRVLPADTDTNKFSVLSNREDTAGYRLYLPEGTTLTMDANYDYFVVIYSTEAFPANLAQATDKANLLLHLKKTHIAKITEQVRIDIANDGIEFSPKLPYELPKDTKFAVYKGPHKTNDTEVVAVAYGLLGDATYSGETRYDEAAIISTPTFYFYNDRLTNKNQLDYSTKYQLNRMRYENNSNRSDATVSVFLTQSKGGSSSTHSTILKEYSPFTYNLSFVDNLANADRTITGANGGREIDKTLFGAGGVSENYTFNHASWNDCFRNVKRSTTNVPSTNLTGPSRHITYINSKEKTNIFPHLIDMNVFTTVSKSGTYAEARFADPNRILDIKIKEMSDFKVRNILFDEELDNDATAELPGLAYYNDTNKVIIKGLNSKQSLSYYAGEPNYIVNASSGTNVEIIKINDYYYKIANVSDIGALTLDSQTGLWTQILTIGHYRHKKDKVWTSGGIQETSKINGVKYYRRKWSNITNNLLVNFNLNSNYTSVINLILKDREYSGNRVNLSTINEDRNLIVPSNLPSLSYNPAKSNTYLNYFSGSFMVDKIIYNGSIEFKEDYIEDGQLKYFISGRDDIHKLLGPIVNKDYLHSQDIIYSSNSPIQKIVTTNVKTTNIEEGVLTTTVSQGTTSAFIGKKLYRSDGAFIGKVKNVVSTTITFTAPARVKYVAAVNGFLFIEDSNYLISDKGLSTHIDATNKANNLQYTSGKGIYFTGGLTLTNDNLQFSAATDGEYSLGYDINSIKNLNQDNPFMFKLSNELTSTIKDIQTVSSLCNYNIVGFTQQEGKDTIVEVAPTSPFILARVDNNSNDTRYSNSQGVYFLNHQGINAGGLINLVSSETTTSSNAKKKSATWTYKNSYFGTPIYRYTDLQKGSGQLFYQSFVNFPQTGQRDSNQIYAKNQGLLSGYATGFKFLEGYTSSNTILPSLYHGNTGGSSSHGTPIATNLKEEPIESRGIYPVIGSNFADFSFYKSNDWRTWPLRKNTLYTGIDVGITENNYDNYANTNIVQRQFTWVMPNDADNTAFFTGISNNNYYDAVRDAKQALEIIDPKVINYHIFSPCDSATESMNEENHIGYSTSDFNFTDFNILMMSEPIDESNNINLHENYLGGFNSKPRINESYQSLPITSASIQPKDMKRFSLGRLTEVGFDFHFNQIDLENPITDNYETNLLHYNKFRMAEKTPVKVTKAATAGDLSIWISSGNWFDTPTLVQGSAGSESEQYDKNRRFKYLTNLDYLFDSQGRFLGIPHYMTRGYFPATDLHGGGAITMTITQNDTDFSNGSYTFNSDGSGGATGAYVNSGDGTFGGTQAFSVTVAGGTVSAVYHTGVNGSNFRAGDTITIAKGDLGGSGDDLILTIQANQIGNKLTFYEDGDNADLNTFPNDTKGIIFNSTKRGSSLQYGDSASGHKLLQSLALNDYLYAMRFEVPYLDVKQRWKFLGFTEDSMNPRSDSRMNLMRYSMRRNQQLVSNARDATSENWRVLSESSPALQHSDYGGTLSNNDQPGHLYSNAAGSGGVELVHLLHGRSVNGSNIANSNSAVDYDRASYTMDTDRMFLGKIQRRGAIAATTTAVRSGTSTGQIASFTTPYEFQYQLSTNGDGHITSLKIVAFNDQTIYNLFGGAIPLGNGKDSYAPLEIGDELLFTGDHAHTLSSSVVSDYHDDFRIVVDAEFLRTCSAGKISGRQNGTFGPSTTHDRYWTGTNYWSEGSTDLRGGIPGSDTPRLNCPLVFKTHNLWDDLEYKLVDQVSIDWNNLPKGRRILSPFAHAQFYANKDTSFKYGNYDGYPFDPDNKAHSIMGGIRESTGLTVSSKTSAGNSSAITVSGTVSNINVGTTLAIWDSVDEPIVVGRVTAVTNNSLTFGAGTKVTLRASETLYKIGVIPLQYWHPSRVVAAMSSNHQDMPMYGYSGASNPYGIYGTNSTSNPNTFYTFGSPKMSSAIYQGGFFVIFKTYHAGSSDLPEYEAGATFKLGTDGWRHASNTGSGTYYQSDVWTGKYDHYYTSLTSRNTPTHNMPIFPVHFNTYPGLYSDSFKNNIVFNPLNTLGTKNWFTKRTDFTTTSTAAATHGSSAYFTNIFNKGRAKADFSKWGDNTIDKDNLGIFAAFKPQLYLCNNDNGTEFNNAAIDNVSIASADSHGRRVITFNLNGDNSYYTAINSWLHFAPNLTGYYLVSNEAKDNTTSNGLPTIWDNFPTLYSSSSEEESHIPKYIHQILDHRIVNWDGHGIAQHEIVIDNASNVSIGKFDYSLSNPISGNTCGYRLMKLSETCTYEKTPSTINLYSMERTYSKLPFSDEMYPKNINRLNTATGDDGDGGSYKASYGNRTNNNDGVYSMYVVLDAESETSGYTVNRDASFIVDKWGLNNSTNVFVTDGVSSFKSSAIITSKSKVSAGAGSVIDSTNPFCLTLDTTKHLRGLVSIGKIFNITVPSTFDLQNFKYGKIGSTFNIGQDVDDIINDLMESNNITYNKKVTTERYITSPNIKGADLYNSLLSVSRLKGLEPRVIGKDIFIKELDDAEDITDITITEGESKVSVSKRNKSTFDLFNEIIVYGDGYKSIKRNSASIKEKGRKTLEETDLNLVTLKQVEGRASDLLKLHTKGLNQIELNLGITDLEYLEVGKIIKVDYPSEHIPVGKYMILEMNYKIGQPMNIVLGFFTKNLDYRIGELITANKNIDSALRGDRYTSFEDTDTLFETLKLKELRIQVQRNTFNYVTTGITVNGSHSAGVTTLNVNYSGNPNIEKGTMLYTLNGELVGYVDTVNYPTSPGVITITSGTSFILDDDTELVSGGQLTTFGFTTNFGFGVNFGFLGNQITTVSEIIYEEDLA
jgi:hypothetical protein